MRRYSRLGHEEENSEKEGAAHDALQPVKPPPRDVHGHVSTEEWSKAWREEEHGREGRHLVTALGDAPLQRKSALLSERS